MSHQLHIVFSSTVKGVGLYDGRPYGNEYSDETLDDWKDLINQASDACSMCGTISDTSNIKNSPVMIVSGSSDQ